MQEILLVSSIVALIFAGLALILSIFNFIEYRADKKSTHRLQFVPADQLIGHGLDGLTDDQRKIFDQDPYEGLA